MWVDKLVSELEVAYLIWFVKQSKEINVVIRVIVVIRGAVKVFCDEEKDFVPGPVNFSKDPD